MLNTKWFKRNVEDGLEKNNGLIRFLRIKIISNNNCGIYSLVYIIYNKTYSVHPY